VLFFDFKVDLSGTGLFDPTPFIGLGKMTVHLISQTHSSINYMHRAQHSVYEPSSLSCSGISFSPPSELIIGKKLMISRLVTSLNGRHKIDLQTVSLKKLFNFDSSLVKLYVL